MALLLVVGVAAWPPRVAEDGGWRLAEEAAARVARTTGAEAVALDGIPPFKSADAMRYPLLRIGVRLQAAEADGAADLGTAAMAVLVCDPLFEKVVGAACGGPAEDAWVARGADGPGARLRLVDRFAAGSRRLISVYAVAAP